MHCRLYLRASTRDQDASRAEGDLRSFAQDHNLTIVGTYRENESGSRLERPELFQLIEHSEGGDILLCEQVDRLSRLCNEDWLYLKRKIEEKGVRVVALDLPSSYVMTESRDEFSHWMIGSINSMLLDMLAAIARKDYEDRRRRQSQGIEKARSEGRYRGRREDSKRNDAIAAMLNNQMSYSQIQDATGASRTTIAKIAKRKVSHEPAKTSLP